MKYLLLVLLSFLINTGSTERLCGLLHQKLQTFGPDTNTECSSHIPCSESLYAKQSDLRVSYLFSKSNVRFDSQVSHHNRKNGWFQFVIYYNTNEESQWRLKCSGVFFDYLLATCSLVFSFASGPKILFEKYDKPNKSCLFKTNFIDFYHKRKEMSDLVYNQLIYHIMDCVLNKYYSGQHFHILKLILNL